MPKLDHVALEVLDMDVSIEFYTKKLGFAFVSRTFDEKENEEYCYLESDGFYLELLYDQRKKVFNERNIQRPYCPHICFATNDMEKTLEELRLKDIQIVHGPLLIENEATWVYFIDPNFNVLEFIQRY